MMFYAVDDSFSFPFRDIHRINITKFETHAAEV